EIQARCSCGIVIRFACASHSERSQAESKDLAESFLGFAAGFDSLTSVRSASSLPVYVAASPAAPFSTSLGMTGGPSADDPEITRNHIANPSNIARQLLNSRFQEGPTTHA